MSRTGKSAEIESRLVVAKDLGETENGEWELQDMGFLFGVIKMLRNQW